MNFLWPTFITALEVLMNVIGKHGHLNGDDRKFCIFKKTKIDLIADQVISGERTNGFGFQ